MKFSEFELVPEVQSGLKDMGFVECTPVQEVTIPHVLEGRDVAGLAQTGTGKTAAFLVPLMDRIVRSQQPQDQANALNKKRAFPNWEKTHFILIIVPTRELAEQVQQNVYDLRGSTSFEAVAIIGGVAYDKQKKALKKGVQFLVATPGRLIDLYKEHLIDLRQVRAVVFDEADRMFDMGFKDDMKYLLQRIPKERQFLVFSATLNFDVLNVAYQFGAHPIECNMSRDQAKAENVKDQIYHVGVKEKPGHLLSIIKMRKPRQAIIFSNFRNNVERIAKFLSDNGFPAVGISSLLTQAQRTRVMTQFRDGGQCNILVATDVAARGLDIKGVDVVINYELPDDAEGYVHRIGRTGRAGETGHAYSLVGESDVDALSRIEEFLKHKLSVEWLEDSDLVTEMKPMKSEDRRARPYNQRRERPKDRSERSPGRSAQSDGPRRSEPRSEPRKRRPEQKDRSVQRHQSNEKTDDSFQKNFQTTHRDRKTGRHGKGSTQSGYAKKRRSERTRRPRTIESKPTTSKANLTTNLNLGQRVAGFFGNLFKKKS